VVFFEKLLSQKLAEIDVTKPLSAQERFDALKKEYPVLAKLKGA
jgi:hypothetical protein